MDTRRATITISETPKENTLSIDVEFFPELNLQDDAFSGLAHLVCTALEAIQQGSGTPCRMKPRNHANKKTSLR
mgnify:FL=1